MFDLVLRNGVIVDGSGGSSYVGDVGILDGLIKEIESFVDPMRVTSLNDAGNVLPHGALDYSLWDMPWNIGNLAYWSFMSEELGVKYSDRCSELIGLYRVIAEHGFAIRTIPGIITICEKPKHVVIEDGKLAKIEWREPVNRDRGVRSAYDLFGFR